MLRKWWKGILYFGNRTCDFFTCTIYSLVLLHHAVGCYMKKRRIMWDCKHSFIFLFQHLENQNCQQIRSDCALNKVREKGNSAASKVYSIAAVCASTAIRILWSICSYGYIPFYLPAKESRREEAVAVPHLIKPLLGNILMVVRPDTMWLNAWFESGYKWEMSYVASMFIWLCHGSMFLVGCFSFKGLKSHQGAGDIANFYNLDLPFSW